MNGRNKRIAVRYYTAEKRIIPVKLVIEKTKSLKPIMSNLISRCDENGIEHRWINGYLNLYKDYLDDGMTCYGYLGFVDGDVRNVQEMEYDLRNMTVDEMNRKYDSIVYLSFHEHRVSLYDCIIR